MTETQHLARHEGRLAFDLVGPSDRPLVIAVPGLGDLRSEYRFLTPRLVAAGFQVATLDVRGHGESDVGFSDHSAAAVGGDVLALADHLGARRVHLVGTSMAAAAAVYAAAERPELVDRMVLIGPFVRDVPTSLFVRLAMRLLFMRPFGPAAWGMYYRTLYPSRPPSDLAQHRDALVRNLREPGRFEALRAMLAASKAPCEARMPEVRARTLVVMGSRDPDFADPGAEARLVASRLSGDVCMVEGAGHYPHAEMPEQLAPTLTSFLAASDAAHLGQDVHA